MKLSNMNEKKVNSVATFLDEVSKIVASFNDDEIIVYRGEDKIFSTPCRPNIFRRIELSSNPNFEKGLFEIMRQNKLTGKDSYILNAIDAQHGEFPSRLLDVSYNALIALYFATTPYRDTEDANDSESGKVFIFRFNELYSPCSEEVEKCYKTIIENSEKWFCDNSLFGKSHKLIDHCKENNRIVAQQGAFILFPGKDVEALPNYVCKEIIIPAKSKEMLRRELKRLFGIHTGTVYPEISNLVNEFSIKSGKINANKFCWDNEIDNVLLHYENELGFFAKSIANSEHRIDMYITIEHSLYSYYQSLVEFWEYANKNQNEIKIERLKKYLDKYNELLDELKKATQNRENEIEIEDFKIKVDK